MPMKHVIVALVFLMVICGTAFAEEMETIKIERPTVSVALTAGVFMPLSSDTKDTFGSSFTRIALTSFDMQKSADWKFIMEAGSYSFSDSDTKLRMIPITAGFERAIGDQERATLPYVAVKAGPYFGRISDSLLGSDNHVGLNVNASLGVVIKNRFYVEGRYDYFSSMEGFNLDGLSISAGIKLFKMTF